MHDGLLKKGARPISMERPKRGGENYRMMPMTLGAPNKALNDLKKQQTFLTELHEMNSSVEQSQTAKKYSKGYTLSKT
jgi:hypothetical protein